MFTPIVFIKSFDWLLGDFLFIFFIRIARCKVGLVTTNFESLYLYLAQSVSIVLSHTLETDSSFKNMKKANMKSANA